MRSYLEVSERVFERGEKVRGEYISKKKRIITLSSSLAVCLVIGIAVWTAMEKNIVTTNELISTDKEQAFTENFDFENSPEKDKKPIISSVSEEENKGSEETDSLKDSFSQKEQNPAGNDGNLVYFSDNNEYNSSISSEENGSDDAEKRKMAGSEVQSSSVFMPAKGVVVVYNDIKEYCDKLNETNSDEKIPVRIDVYWEGELITDQVVLNGQLLMTEVTSLCQSSGILICWQ